MILACSACFSPSAQVFTLKIGTLFGLNRHERINLCAKCRSAVWSPWRRATAFDGVDL